MPLPFQTKHLRVEIPLTTDGMNLKYVNGKPQYKIVVLPFSAKRNIESNQVKKPDHLKAKITVVEGDMPKKEVKKMGRPKKVETPQEN